MKRFVAIFVLALVAAACSPPAPDSTTVSESESVDVVTREVDRISVLASELTNSHVDPPASFEQSPAVGGDHYPFWHNCGFYDVELIEGAAVHSLEHGAVWITYSSAASAAHIAELQAMAENNDRLLVSPYDHEEIIVVSAWGEQLRGDIEPSSAEVAAFIEERVNHPDSPEPGVSCGGAAGVAPSDARTMADGTVVPDEWT